jgi:hypothetical protein
MLSYTPVTDLIRHTDDPAKADLYFSMRGTATGHLRAAE